MPISHVPIPTKEREPLPILFVGFGESLRYAEATDPKLSLFAAIMDARYRYEKKRNEKPTTLFLTKEDANTLIVSEDYRDLFKYCSMQNLLDCGLQPIIAGLNVFILTETAVASMAQNAEVAA